MKKSDVFAFITNFRYGVVGTIGPGGTPQSALAGIAVTPMTREQTGRAMRFGYLRELLTVSDPTLGIHRIPNEYRKSLGLDDFETAQGSYERIAKFVARAQRSGVMLLAGTDDASLFDEVESYAKAGVPTSVILDSAGINGARWLGKENDFGSIQAGRRADLVLLDDDPMKDIKNLRRVAIVIKDGRIVARNEVKSQGAGKAQ